jgi:Asp-tRNA(Asn)/Glu-tRNA(Gln) amidotransferase C subunit
MPVEIDIEHVAKLARLELTDEEKARLREQLGVILAPSLSLEDVLANAPEVEADRFRVPRVVEME